MPISRRVATLRATRANAVLRGDLPAAELAKRDLTAAKLEEYIVRLVDDAPPLTDEQRDRLAAILRRNRAATSTPTGGDVP